MKGLLRFRLVVAGVTALAFVALGSACSSSSVGEGADIGVVDTGGGDDSGQTDTGGTVPTCESNADCDGVFGALGPCRVAVCNAQNQCENRAKKDFVTCDDGDVCTTGSFCLEGACTGGRDLSCNDGNACTRDYCDPLAGGCLNEDLTGNSCDDGDPCTEGDLCHTGVCRGEASDTCPCTADADCAPYEDGNLCNGTLVCTDGQCTVDSDTRVACDTSGDTDCRATVCEPETGACVAQNSAAGTSCEDGNACTTGDSCNAGLCVGGPNQCQCEVAADCAEYEDGDFCNGTLVCVGAACVVDQASVVTCDAPTDPCLRAVCVPVSGQCQDRPKADGTACDDGDACTTADRCVGGSCGGTARACDDADACTTDACDAATGQCTHQPLACDDGDACTTDSCDPATGTCTYAPKSCDDSDPCTVDTCDAASGACGHQAAADMTPCDDGNACTVGDVCADGACVGAGINCDDEDPCTVDTCDAQGGCDHTPVVCEEDQDPCTTVVCDSAAGGCVPVPVGGGAPCDDGDACTEGDACFDGACVGDPLDCDDGDACTTDSCDADQGGCVHVARDCDDGIECTIDSCDGQTGQCVYDTSNCGGDEDCTNQIDDDDDGLTDCDDVEDCNWHPTCQPACEDDVLEDDDSMATATPVPSSATYADLTSAWGDDDWFEISVCDGGVLTIAATFLHADGDVDLYLLDATGDERDSGISGDDDELIVYEATADETLWLMVEMWDEDGCNRYDLSFSLDDSGCGGGPEDCFDGVDNDGDDRVDCADPDCSGVVSTPGACTNDADLAIAGRIDVQALGQECILGGDVPCLGDAACITGCIQDATGLSEGCAGCGGALGACVVSSCFLDCADTSSQDCASCIETECFPAYMQCFGVLHCDFEYDCDGGVDDDGDGLVDCADADCAGVPPCVPVPEDCTNEVDDDGDGQTDCDDSECEGHPACVVGPEDCFDGVDNDGDGRADCADSDCSGVVTTPGACTNDADLAIAGRVDVQALGQECILGGDVPCLGDAACITGCIQGATGLSDGCAGCGGALGACVVSSCFVDCADSSSQACATCIETQCFPDYVACFGVLHCDFEYGCTGGVDDDGDGLVDCADADCDAIPPCAVVPENCTNEVDDDGDGATDCDDTDCGDDPACIVPPEDCNNEVDDDLDGATDCDDTDCETDPACVIGPEVCDNDVDDDQDGATDCDDADCDADPACQPPPPEICGNGLDDDGDGAYDCADSDCFTDPDCATGDENCFDGVDNDDDGRADCEDPDCSGTVAIEGACTNDADLPLAGRADIIDLGQTCILDQGCGGDVACNTACVQNELGVSEGCATCGGELAGCVFSTCLLSCIDPTNPACATCIEAECFPAYTDCFGTLHCGFEYFCANGVSDDEDGLVDCADPDCAADPVCNACVDDAHEDNDDATQAELIVPTVFLADLVSGSGDEDWFAVQVCSGGLLSARATFDVENDTLELAAVRADGSLLSTGGPVSNGRRLAWRSTVTGTIYLRIRQPEPNACVAYGLGVTFDATGCPTPDPEICADGIDNDADGAVDCDDPDCVDDPACVVTVEDCFDGVDNDADGRADCRDPECSAAIAVEGACTNPQDLPIAGRIDVQALGRTCIVDAGCGGDATCNADCIQDRTGVTAACATCGGDLAACVVSDCIGACGLTPDAPECSACIDTNCWPAYTECFGLLHCPFEYLCDDGVDDDDDGLLDCADDDCAAQPICNPVEVEICFDGIDNDGDLLADCADPDCVADPYCTIACRDDRLEDNDSRATALPLAPPVTEAGLVSADGDDDWFALDVCDGGLLVITARFLTADGDVDLYLYPEAGDVALDQSISQSDNEQIRWRSDRDGTVYLAVTMWDEAGCNAYDLEISFDDSGCAGPVPEICDDGADNDGDGLADCLDPDCDLHPNCQAEACGGDDRFEDNDRQNAATRVPGSATFANLVSVSTDDDWFRVPVCDGGTLDLAAFFTHALGDIDMALVGRNGVEIDISQSATDNERLRWDSTFDGAVFVRVYFYDDANIGTTCNVYDLDIAFDDTGCSVTAENCFDTIDNDGDGRADCADPDCSMAVAVDGACTNPDDLLALGGVDVAGLALQCILGPPPCLGDEACNSQCVVDATGVSDGCAACGGGAAACAFDVCFDVCLDPSSPACTTCLDTSCWPGYEDCFGTLRCGYESDCTNGTDDEGDGLVDCLDPDCAAAPTCL